MVKISIISGFLGAGKSTFIKKLLKEGFFGHEPILIENDFGRLGIDGTVMEASGVRVREINSGCICCSLVGRFVLALEELIEQNQPEQVIIEPSGVGKLSEILEALKDLKVPYEKRMAVTIVDAGRFDHNSRYVEEYFWDQVSSADAAVLSKTQKLSQMEISRICAEISERTGGSPVLCSPWDVPYAPLLNGIKSASLRPLCFAAAEQENQSEFESWSRETTLEYSLGQLDKILGALSQDESLGAVVRAKGILNTPEGPMLLDFVSGGGSLTSVFPNRSGRVLVIGKNLNRPALEQLFQYKRITYGK